MKPDNLLVQGGPGTTTQKCTTGCPNLDRCLGGGIPVNSITEIVAESGSGKTQLCLQLLLCAQFQPSHGGLAGSSLYIHSEFPFPSNRLQQLSHAFRSSSTSHLFATEGDDPCDHVFVRGVHRADQLFDILSGLDSVLANPAPPTTHGLPVKLIVIDSIAALFRSEFDNTPLDLKRRSSLFFKISGKLKFLAKRFGLAVVVTNHVVDMVEANGVNGLRIGNLQCLWSSGRRVSPALGISWANCVNSRLFLSRNEEIISGEHGLPDVGVSDSVRRLTRRRLQVVFAPHLPDASCEFVITREGVFGANICRSG